MLLAMVHSYMIQPASVRTVIVAVVAVTVAMVHSTAIASCYGTQYSDSKLKACVSCLPGADCSILGSSLTSQTLQPGYWRAVLNTTDVRKCWVAKACIGDTNRTAATRRLAHDGDITQTETRYCAAGYRGPCTCILYSNTYHHYASIYTASLYCSARICHTLPCAYRLIMY
jgi:hypothetical protein